MDFNNIFEKLKKNKWVWLIYIPLTIAANLLILFTGECFASILVALFTFGIPYLFGLRSMKTYLIAGTAIIIVTGILFGAVIAYFMYNQMYIYEPKDVRNSELIDGSVTPYLGDETTLFNYTVRYTGDENPVNITVYVNITGLAQEFKESIPLKNATDGLYYNATVLDKNVYIYIFSAYLNNSNKWIETHEAKPGFGPITLSYSELLELFIFNTILQMFMGSGLFFYMFLVLFWWRKKAKEERMKWKEDKGVEEKPKPEKHKEEVKEEEGEFECTECGADVSADATECWKCGEKFEGEELEVKEAAKAEDGEEVITGTGTKKEKKEVYTCNACGAEVDADATKCWNCGERFEDMDEEGEEKGNEPGEE